MDYMKQFILLEKGRKGLEIPYIQDAKTKRSYLYLDTPHILALFAGYLKKNLLETAKSHVFFRGQTNDYGTMIPRLFRGNITLNQLEKRILAYKKLINELPKTYEASRFQKESVGAILQHYGIKTPWLDLVDNLYTAIWFATKEPKRASGKPIEYINSKKEFGWLYFIRTKINNKSELKWYDLREEQSSLSLRLHVQHGISATRENVNWNLSNRCLNDFVVALVKFPNNKDWSLEGSLFSTKFIFPSKKIDNTYKYLKKKKFTNLINSIINEYQLEEGELGKINEYINR